MVKTKIPFHATIFILLMAACAPLTAAPATPSPSVTEEIPITGMAIVQSVEIQILESQPLQVNAIIRGQLPDAGCTTIKSVDQARDGNIFKVTLTTTTDPLALCAQVLTPFERVIALDVKDLPSGTYIVNVNGIEVSFQRIADITSFKQSLVEVLNARNYDLLKTLMDKSLMIALYRSKGSAYDVESAIEQLKLNHLNATTPITADLNKDLTTLLNGIDPLSIFGLDVGPNFALFLSGWGLDGKDEAILYVNYLLDGSLYWHGVLVAKGGFAQSNNGSNPPADISVHATDVEYILALKDVTIYSGPGSSFGVIGQVASGQIARVTGNDSNDGWWRIVCPDDSVGSCWVSADPALTQPTTVPHSNQPLPPGYSQPTTVKYVLAQKDIPIYGGASTQYSVIGSISSGQIAKVTGLSADGNWWRVICPDDTVGNCWVSSNPADTQPTQSP